MHPFLGFSLGVVLEFLNLNIRPAIPVGKIANKQSEGDSKYSAMLSKLHSYRLLFWRLEIRKQRVFRFKVFRTAKQQHEIHSSE